jgi:hypothetical protein
MKSEQHLQVTIVCPLGRGPDAQKQFVVTGPEIRTLYEGDIEGESPMSQVFMRLKNFLPPYAWEACKENKSTYQCHFFTSAGSRLYVQIPQAGVLI